MPRFIILTILKAFLEPLGCLEQFATDIYILIEPVHKPMTIDQRRLGQACAS